MIIFAMIIHALSAIAFVAIGLIVLSNDGTLATNDVTITLALLGFNVAVHYFRVALESNSSDTKLSREQQRERMRQQVRERDERTPSDRASREMDKPQAIVEAEQRHSQALAEAERNVEWHDD